MYPQAFAALGQAKMSNPAFDLPVPNEAIRQADSQTGTLNWHILWAIGVLVNLAGCPHSFI
ncbi:hypothetical protein NC999_15165 [Leptolyngbya sp. GB2-A1]